jgi:hypothetical protein
MLAFLRGKASGRKLRLFACAGCRLVWSQLGEGARRAVEASERFADRLVSPDDLKAARDGIGMELFEGVGGSNWCAASAWDAASEREPERAWGRGLRDWRPGRVGRWLVYGVAVESSEALKAAYEATHSSLLRDLFSPFRPPVAIDPAVLPYDGGASPRLAEAIYRDQRFEDLPVLADLLEEAGCTDAALLGHLRGPGPHALGCWALDAALGRC